MLKNFTYSYPTKIVFGRNSIYQLGSLLSDYSPNKVMLVFGSKSIKKNGVYESIYKQIGQSHIKLIDYGNCEPNPDSDFVNKGANIAISEDVDFILAAGGGSVIDAAKAMALLINNESTDGIWPYMRGDKKLTSNAVPIGVILTAVGTGSEGNGSFVISDAQTSNKLGLSHLSTRPKFAICDPYYTLTLSSFQSSCGSADIISHLLEQYFCAEEGEHLSNYLIIATLKHVMHHAREVTLNENNIESRSNLMLASSFALSYALSLGKTLDWSTHRIEHSLSGIYPDITHGAGIACILPAWMSFASRDPKVGDKITSLGKELGLFPEETKSEVATISTIAYFKKFFHSLGLKTRLSQVSKNKIDVKKVSRLTMSKGPLGIIFPIDERLCTEILESIL